MVVQEDKNNTAYGEVYPHDKEILAEAKQGMSTLFENFMEVNTNPMSERNSITPRSLHCNSLKLESVATIMTF